jgi:hypothetical protein
MKRTVWAFLALGLIGLMLAGCSSHSGMDGMDMPETGSDAMVPIVAALKVTPEKAKPGEPVHFEVKVSQGDKPITKPKEMEFEFWKDGQSEKHLKVKGKTDGGGVYTADQTFQDAGTYFVISHVTAANMHTMPKQQFTVHP